MRRAAKVDDNQKAIVRALRAVGASVEPRLSRVGGGCPDLLVGFQGDSYVMEVKDPSKPPSGRKLTPDELVWQAQWAGQYDVVLTAEDALRAIGAIE
jgi:hypothetical protein